MNTRLFDVVYWCCVLVDLVVRKIASSASVFELADDFCYLMPIKNVSVRIGVIR